MTRRHELIMVMAFASLVVALGGRSLHAIPSDLQGPVAALRMIGGTVFERDGTVVEVNLNRTNVRDDDLGQLAGFTAMTDLSLEETAIGDDGLRRLSGLKSLAWLNRYKTQVTAIASSHPE